CRALGRPLRAVRNKLGDLELGNGSRFVALPGRDETIRSFSGVALLIIDEAARVADDFYRSMRLMLAVSRGRLVALSTPFGRRGWVRARVARRRSVAARRGHLAAVHAQHARLQRRRAARPRPGLGGPGA